MSGDLHFCRLMKLVGRKHAAKWGNHSVTIGAVGFNECGRWVMGYFADGTVVFGEPGDFRVIARKRTLRSPDA